MTSIGAGPARQGAQIHKRIDHCANQIPTQNVQGRMLDRLRVVCPRFLGRARALFVKREFGWAALTAKLLQPRRTTGILLTVLSLVTLAYRTGVPVQSTRLLASLGLLQMWHATEHEVILLQNRVRADYQSVQLLYQLTRQIRNLPEQPRICEQRAMPNLDPCKAIEQAESPEGRTPDPAALGMARNWLPCSLSLN